MKKWLTSGKREDLSIRAKKKLRLIISSSQDDISQNSGEIINEIQIPSLVCHAETDRSFSDFKEILNRSESYHVNIEDEVNLLLPRKEASFHRSNHFFRSMRNLRIPVLKKRI